MSDLAQCNCQSPYIAICWEDGALQLCTGPQANSVD